MNIIFIRRTGQYFCGLSYIFNLSFLNCDAIGIADKYAINETISIEFDSSGYLCEVDGSPNKGDFYGSLIDCDSCGSSKTMSAHFKNYQQVQNRYSGIHVV